MNVLCAHWRLIALSAAVGVAIGLALAPQHTCRATIMDANAEAAVFMQMDR